MGNPSYSIRPSTTWACMRRPGHTHPSILPPFQVLLAQVIRKLDEPDIFDPSRVQVYSSAVSNPNDPIRLRTSYSWADQGRRQRLQDQFLDIRSRWDPTILLPGQQPVHPVDSLTRSPARPSMYRRHRPTRTQCGTALHRHRQSRWRNDTGLAAAQQDMPGILRSLRLRHLAVERTPAGA